MLTRSQAWREIARRIAEGDWFEQGLCREIIALYDARKIGKTVFNEMNSQVSGNLPLYSDAGCFGFAFPYGEQNVRVLAALFLALEK